MTIFKTLIFILIYLVGISHPIETKSQTSNDSTGAKAKELLLDTIVDILKTRSIYRDNVNWNDLTPQLYKSIDYSISNSAKAIIPAYIKLSEMLNITHGGLSYEGKSYGAFNIGSQEMQNRISNNVREAAKKTEFNFRTEIIAKKYGYISIPPIEIEFSEDMEKVKQEMQNKASIIQDSLCKLQIPGLKGIILDLRLNNGGSTPAMIGGLTSLYDETTLFTFVMADGTGHKVIKGKKYLTFYKDTLIKLEPKCPVSNQLKLAVLISPYTASAAEQTAISFEGRHNTKFIGEKTKGMTTAIHTMLICKDLILDYAEAHAEDRNGNAYKNGVSPDIAVVMGDDFENLGNDKKIQAAIKWFTEQK
jgi:carboxyl-terminal processing protease